MKIKVISPCYISGKHHQVGDILEVGDLSGRDLINMERAVPVREEAKAPEPKPEPKPTKGGK